MIMAYIYDFISFLFEKELKSEIKNIILHGSVASGNYDEKSDIDIFIEPWDRRKKTTIEKNIKEQLSKFEDKAARIWYPMGIKNTFSIIVDDLNSPKWKNVRYDIVSNGMLLYSKFKSIPENLQHNVLITFSTNKLKQSDKMKLIISFILSDCFNLFVENVIKTLCCKFSGMLLNLLYSSIPLETMSYLTFFHLGEFRSSTIIENVFFIPMGYQILAALSSNLLNCSFIFFSMVVFFLLSHGSIKISMSLFSS